MAREIARAPGRATRKKTARPPHRELQDGQELQHGSELPDGRELRDDPELRDDRELHAGKARHVTRFESLDVCRACAALAVCIFHFAGSKGYLAADSALRTVTWYGQYGVEAFFVISGFVIPWSMQRSGYEVRRYPRFLARRLTRLDPPYLISIGVVFALAWLAIALLGERAPDPPTLHWPALLAHLGYANAVLEYEWLNPVYWSLGIEFQYYLALGLIYPVIASDSRLVRIAGIAGLLALSWLPCQPHLLPHWLPIFALGFVTFQWKSGRVPRIECAVMLAVVCTVSCLLLGYTKTCAGLAVVLAIFHGEGIARMRWMRPLASAGLISYSVYLLHWPIGRLVLSFGRLSDSTAVRVALIIVAVLLTLLASWIFYRLIEKPSQRLAGKIRYDHPRASRVTEGALGSRELG